MSEKLIDFLENNLINKRMDMSSSLTICLKVLSFDKITLSRHFQNESNFRFEFTNKSPTNILSIIFELKNFEAPASPEKGRQ